MVSKRCESLGPWPNGINPNVMKRVAFSCFMGGIALLCIEQNTFANAFTIQQKKVRSTELYSFSSRMAQIARIGYVKRRIGVQRKFFRRFLSNRKIETRKAKRTRIETSEKLTYEIDTLEQLDRYWNDEDCLFRNEKGKIDYDALLNSVSVVGDTQIIGSVDHPEYVHPVAKLLHERKQTNSKFTTEEKREDGCRVALAIEGGGMRGCVSAGMVCALHHLNLTDTFDVIYGSSAGGVVGAYFLTGQLPWFGPEVYYDRLTTAGNQFIDKRRLLRALGFGLLDPRLFKDVLTRPDGKPVLNLSFLLEETVQEKKPLDWNKFVEMQKVLPLKIVASGLASEHSVVMDMEKGHFKTLHELTQCMHASCLLPGVAGPVMNLNKRALNGESDLDKFYVANNRKRVNDHIEPMADGLLYEPMPYRSALKEGCTHVVVIRSRPDGSDATGKASFFEKLILKRFFTRKNRLPKMFKRMKKKLHKKVYAEDIITLNEFAKSDRHHRDLSSPHVLTLAVSSDCPEVGKLETGRETIFNSVREGFARAYDALVEDPAERGRGMEVAKHYFPEEILDYEPLEIDSNGHSAFEVYMRENSVSPEIWGSEGFSIIKESQYKPTFVNGAQEQTETPVEKNNEDEIVE